MSDTIKGLAALRIHLGKMGGVEFEKKITRYNDIASMCDLYASCGGGVSAESCLNEVIDYCAVGSPMHIPKKSIAESVDEYAWKWLRLSGGRHEDS